MHQDRDRQTAAESSYHLVHGVEQDYAELLQAIPDLETDLKADLAYVGENSETAGTSLNRVDRIERYSKDKMSQDDLEKLKASRVLTRDAYAIYWITASTDEGGNYAAIWQITRRLESEGPAAVSEFVIDGFRKIRKAFEED